MSHQLFIDLSGVGAILACVWLLVLGCGRFSSIRKLLSILARSLVILGGISLLALCFIYFVFPISVRESFLVGLGVTDQAHAFSGEVSLLINWIASIVLVWVIAGVFLGILSATNNNKEARNLRNK